MNSVTQAGDVQAGQWTLNGCTERGGVIASFAIVGETFCAGRKNSSDLVLQSSCVSGRHAEVFHRGNRLFLRDLNSTNGTFVNGVRVKSECPIESGDRVQFADMEFVVAQHCKADSTDDWAETVQKSGSLKAMWVISQFEKLTRSGLYAAYQPVVIADGAEVYGKEALARGEIAELQRPDQMFETAEQIGEAVALSCRCREVALRTCHLSMWPDQPLFLNTHPSEDLFADVLPSLRELRAKAPRQRITVEIHEGAVTCPGRAAEFHQELRLLNMELAYDDFGAGQTRLRELIEVPPDYIKFDRGIISGLHTASEIQQDLVLKLVEMCDRVGARTIAEGVEEPECADFCRSLGFDLIQGYLYGRPTRPEPEE